MEYLDARRIEEALGVDGGAERLTDHGHCHQNSVEKDHHAVGVLRRTGLRGDPLDTSCCGMAGTFGYESEHDSMSQATDATPFDRIDDSDGDAVVAPDASCRTQIGDEYDERPAHPIETIADALAEGAAAGGRRLLFK